MNDPEMPYLVDDPTYPPGFSHYSPHMPHAGTPWPGQHPSQSVPDWVTAGNDDDAGGSPWPGASRWPPTPAPAPAPVAAGWPGIQTAMPQFGYNAPTPMAPMFAAAPAHWPGMATPIAGVGVVAPPAVFVDNPAYSTADDDWVHAGNQSDDWDWHPRQAKGHRRPLSRSGSRSSRTNRPSTPFSANSSPSSGSSNISRSKSFTRPVSETEKRPPREWRPDFSMSRSSSLGSAITSLLASPKRPKSVARRDSVSSVKVQLHPYLRYSTAVRNMYYDLRGSPEDLNFYALDRKPNPWDFTRFACEPPLSHMRLYSHYFPWYIEIQTENPSGVTLRELFAEIWKCMMTPISQGDYYNTEVNQAMREEISYAWAARCGDDKAERRRGVCRVDFLMERVVFEGLAKGKEGMWEMKIKKP